MWDRGRGSFVVQLLSHVSLQPQGLQHTGFPVLYHLPELAQTHVHWLIRRGNQSTVQKFSPWGRTKIFFKKILPDNIDSQLLGITTESMRTGKLGHNRPLHGSWPLVGSRAGLVSRRTYLFAKSNWSVHLSVHSSRCTCWIPARSRVLWQGSRPLFLSSWKPSQGFHSSRGSFCEARTLRHLWDKMGNIKDTKGVHSLVYPPGVASYKRCHFTETRMLCER